MTGAVAVAAGDETADGTGIKEWREAASGGEAASVEVWEDGEAVVAAAAEAVVTRTEGTVAADRLRATEADSTATGADRPRIR